MHLVLLHGYLLQGTGSNIYVANVARAWCRQGHAVTVVCQDRAAATASIVDEVFLPTDRLPQTSPGAGRLRVIVPDIASLLPAYVLDRYAGYTVKALPEMTEEEIERHVALTAGTLRHVATVGADRVLANHVLLGPVIARRALAGTGVPYDVKIHGSALEYTLVPTPRLMPYAVEGLQGAERIYAGTRHVYHRALEVFRGHRGDLDLDARLCIVPPGMDPDLFAPTSDAGAAERLLLASIRRKVEEDPNGRTARAITVPYGCTPDELHRKLVEAGDSYDQRAIDADLPARWPEVGRNEPIICYFGKFLAAKGVGELLMTFPRVLEGIPESRLVLVGFGEYREHLEGMIHALRTGDVDAFCRYARAGDFVEEQDVARWFRGLSKDESSRITVTGILDHECLRHLLPLASLSVVPSKWPEAFGMVAVEAMAAGVLPLCTYHAGLRDVVDQVAAASAELGNLIALPRDRFVEELPLRICAALGFLYPDGFGAHAHRREVGTTLRAIAVERFSWDRVARRLLDPMQKSV